MLMSGFCSRKFGVVMLEVAVLAVAAARAEVQLPALISDGMVLQQGVKVNIWGAAAPGEHVSVMLQDQKASGVANGGGEWKVQLGPLRAGGPFTLTVAGRNTLTVHDVLVGEVWICSGQSNMAMPVSGVANAQDEIARADYPTLRLFTVRDCPPRPSAPMTGKTCCMCGELRAKGSLVMMIGGERRTIHLLAAQRAIDPLLV
jgi:sialate O-acetylesterase